MHLFNSAILLANIIFCIHTLPIFKTLAQLGVKKQPGLNTKADILLAK